MSRLLKPAIALCVVFSVSGCFWFEPKMTTLCEAAIKDGLLSPSSYRRIEVNQITEPLTREQYGRHLQIVGGYASSSEIYQMSMRRFDEGFYKPVKIKLLFSFDAANAFNASLRQHAVCEHFSEHGNADNVTNYSIKVNGKGFVERLTGRP